MALICAAVTALASGVATAQAEYDGTAAFVAFQTNTSDLWLYKTSEETQEPGTTIKTGFGMAPDTSPSASLAIYSPNPARHELVNAFAFQTNGNQLWIWELGLEETSGGTLNKYGLGMEPKTSPSWDNEVVSFQANNTDLYRFNWQLGAQLDTGIGMAANTSPSGEFVRVNTGYLWKYNPYEKKGEPTSYLVAPNTSPSAAGDMVAFQGSDGNLWIYYSNTGEVYDLGYGMAAGTSPSVVEYGSGYEVAFQTNGNQMWTWNSKTGLHKFGLGMRAGTSPSITNRADDGVNDPEVAFQANNTDLYLYRPLRKEGGSTGLGMAEGTSPYITAEYTDIGN